MFYNYIVMKNGKSLTSSVKSLSFVLECQKFIDVENIEILLDNVFYDVGTPRASKDILRALRNSICSSLFLNKVDDDNNGGPFPDLVHYNVAGNRIFFYCVFQEVHAVSTTSPGPGALFRVLPKQKNPVMSFTLIKSSAENNIDTWTEFYTAYDCYRVEADQSPGFGFTVGSETLLPVELPSHDNKVEDCFFSMKNIEALGSRVKSLSFVISLSEAISWTTEPELVGFFSDPGKIRDLSPTGPTMHRLITEAVLDTMFDDDRAYGFYGGAELVCIYSLDNKIYVYYIFDKLREIVPNSMDPALGPGLFACKELVIASKITDVALIHSSEHSDVETWKKFSTFFDSYSGKIPENFHLYKSGLLPLLPSPIGPLGSCSRCGYIYYEV